MTDTYDYDTFELCIFYEVNLKNTMLSCIYIDDVLVAMVDGYCTNIGSSVAQHFINSLKTHNTKVSHLHMPVI